MLLRRLACHSRAIVGSAAAAAALATHVTGVPQRTSSAEPATPWEGVLTARASLRSQLHADGCSEQEVHAALARVKLAIKGDRLCATVALPRDVLPALVPFLRAFPLVTWVSDANGSPGGESVVLRDVKDSDAPLLSLFVPRSGGAAELEVLGARSTKHGTASPHPTLGEKETRALAQSLLVMGAQPRAGGESSTPFGGGHPSPGFPRVPGGLLGELFGSLDGGGSGGQSGARNGAQGGLGSGGRGGGGGSPIERLEALGVRVILPAEGADASSGSVDTEEDSSGGWGSLAGSAEVHRSLEESLLLPLLHPEVYEEVMKGTRRQAVAPHAKAILFTGPPGCGKTSTARILAHKLGRPFVALPLESLVSKWYGEAEQRLATVFDACQEMGSAVIFLDEIDALATSRDGSGGMHEATRRSLSVALNLNPATWILTLNAPRNLNLTPPSLSPSPVPGATPAA